MPRGVRYLLLVRLVRAGSIEQIDRLLQAYADEGMAAWLFGRALHLYRLHGEGPEAGDALRAAKKANLAYLLGERPIPEQLPDYVGFGDETEAAW